MANEDNKHYLLHCPRCNQSQRGLFHTVVEALGSDIANLHSIAFTSVENKILIEATIGHIKNVNRLA